MRRVFPRIELLPDPDKTVPKDACWPRGGDIRVAQAFGQGRGGPGAKIGAVESGFHFMPSGATCGVDGYVVDRTRPFELMNQVEKSEYLAMNSSVSSSASGTTTSSRLGEEEKIKFNADWAREFHVFAVEWDKESLRFFIDDVFTHEVNAYSAPMIPRWPFFVGIGTSVSPSVSWKRSKTVSKTISLHHRHVAVLKEISARGHQQRSVLLLVVRGNCIADVSKHVLLGKVFDSTSHSRRFVRG